jgi:Putative transposase of IS4/5 family (DUF4096)
MRYELADCEWTAISPMLPNKARGVPRVDDRRILNGIFWVLRSGAPWRDCRIAMAHTPPATTASSVGDGLGRIMGQLAAAHDAAVQMIDTFSPWAGQIDAAG